MSHSTGNGTIDFIDELKWRGLWNQCTDEEGLRAHLAGGARAAYVGYDPTAPSLTIGNLVTIMLLVHFWRAGHVPVVVVGGGTGMIGDPSGKSAERQLNTIETVRANVEGQRPIFERIFANAAALEDRPALRPAMLNNADWLMPLGFIEALRDIGKHFSVNEMIKRDSVRTRLEQRDQGISYTEFSYILLQSYDFLVLFRDFAKFGLDRPVTLQMGGSDQWGNIVGGLGLIRSFCIAEFLDQAWKLPHEVQKLEALLIERTVDRYIGESNVPLAKPSESDFAQSASVLERDIEVGINVVIRRLPLAARVRTEPRPKVLGAISASPRPQDMHVSDHLNDITSFAKRLQNEAEAHSFATGVTCPLVTKADGGKFGKTESGAVWLTPDRTSPYAFYQFWLNAADADVGRFLRIFTLHPREAIERIEGEHAKDPGQRVAQRELARAATALLHGPEAVRQAEAAAAALFSGEIAGLPESTLREVLAEVPSSEHPRASLEAGVPLLELLPQTTLAKSKSEARQLLSEGSISVNGRKAAAGQSLTPADLLHGSIIALRRGKKNWHVTRWA